MRFRRLPVVVVALATLAAPGLACGNDESKAAPQLHVSVDPAAMRTPRQWTAPTVARTTAGASVAVFRSSTPGTPPARIRLRGVGFAAVGKGAGHPYVTTGVDSRYTSINHGTYVASIGLTGRSVRLVIWSRGGQWRAKVDGRYVRTAPQSVGSDYALHTIGLDLGPGSEGRPHHVDFELRNGAHIAGVQVGQGDRLWLAGASRRPRIYWLGDSFFAGAYARYPGFDDLVHQTSSALGLNDVTVDALGGTGYVKGNQVTRWPSFAQRVLANIGRGRAQPDVIVVGGSINDTGYGTGIVRAAAARVFAELRRRASHAKVVAVTFGASFPVSAGLRTAIAGVDEAARAAPNVIGTVDLASELNAGNVARMVTKDGHPTAAAHRVYARELTRFLRNHGVR